VHGVTLRDKVRSCEIHKAMTVEPLPDREILAPLVRPCDQGVPATMDQTRPAGYTQGKAPEKTTKNHEAWLQLRTCLVLSRCGVEL